MAEIRLEIVCCDEESVRAAFIGGADRIELCENLEAGGETPSAELIQSARKNFSKDLFVMIRPRGGNFIYSKEELNQMKKDISLSKQLKADGIVLGLLKEDGSVDKTNLSGLVKLSGPLPVTFHRAFDEAGNPWNALEDIIECGCKRILTSGQQSLAQEGMALIAEMIEKSAGRIVVMPGGGVRPANVAAIIERTKAAEIHSSARSKESAGKVDQETVHDLKKIITKLSIVKS